MNEQFHLGASWYPEMWPEATWEADIVRMRELGFTLMRVLEFAWCRLEPDEGVYDLVWVRRLLDLCHKHGMQIMIGTPTAAPPIWLTDRHPDTLRTEHTGKRDSHGRRKHYSQISATYRHHCTAIVDRLAREFASHPAVHSWQIDNEMSGFDYGPEAVTAFHAWLERRFGDVETMNRTWGLDVWSQRYQRFDQVPMPVAELGSIEQPERHHPSLVLAVARFQNDAWYDYIAGQCAAIRRHSDKPITSNMAGGMGTMQWQQHNRQLDRVGHSMYADVLHYHYNLPKFDRMRAEKRRGDTYLPYWLLETAPSWSAGGRTWNIHHDGRGVQAFTWLAILLGGSMCLYWHWREHWAGQEMLHGTLLTADGRWRPNHQAIAAIASGFRSHGAWLGAHPPAPARLGVMVDWEASWTASIDPTDVDMRYEERIRDDLLVPLSRAHWWRDAVSFEADLSGYRVLVLPYAHILPEATRRRLAAWVEAGGRLILGPLTGYRSSEYTAFTDRAFGGLEDLIGADAALRFTNQWMEDRVRIVFADGRESRTRTWAEAWEPHPGTEVLARWRDGYGDGLPAIVSHRHGAGEVITLGGMVESALWVELIASACLAAGLKPEASGDPSVVVCPRCDASGTTVGWGLVNLTEQPARIRLPRGGRDLLSGIGMADEAVLEPLQVRLVAIEG
jgi:beta-galactosidase GanA